MATLSWMVLQQMTKTRQKEGPIFLTNIPGKKCWVQHSILGIDPFRQPQRNSKTDPVEFNAL